MHLLIPHAVCSDPASQAQLHQLRQPNLHALMKRLTPIAPDLGASDSIDLPHERVLARALGWPVDSPLSPYPWAARQALMGGHAEHPEHDKAWAFITPAHWQIDQAQVTLSNPQTLNLSESESRALLAAMQPYFKEDGIALHFESATRWLACGEVFRGLFTASPERVVGLDVKPWMPAAPLLRRLQNEMQMLLYAHPVNEERLQRKVLPVNSFWVSGSGALMANNNSIESATNADMPIVLPQLMQAALQQNWHAWRLAWEHIDATDCAALLDSLARGNKEATLTLCGERHAQSYKAIPRGLWKKMQATFNAPSLQNIAHSL